MASWPIPSSRPALPCATCRSKRIARSGQFAFAYTVTIRNSGDVTGQLIGRHWIVSDANGHVEEVRGLAVVGTSRC